MTPTWNTLPPPPQEFLEQHPELPPIVAHLLYHRDIRSQKQIDEFLNPDYLSDVHDPFLFVDMEKAVARLLQAVEHKERVTVYGDYDADGVSASVILTSLFRALKHDNLSVYLPHRETDGYGLNKKAIQLLADEGTKVIITCDCGISNAAEVELANSLGIDVIITDHHAIPSTLPLAFAIIHPKLERETYPDKGLAGGGVAFKLLQGVLKKHKETNDLLPNGQSHDTFEKWQLDMVAIASVADMVPLLGESRTLTKYGLIVLNKTKRIGLQKLLLEAKLMDEQGGLKFELDADTIGFKIAPRINAAGRMDHANVAYNLLVEERPIEATDLAFQLDQNNQERQKNTELFVSQAIEQIIRDQKDWPVLMVIDSDWTPGIVGLVASRLKEKYHKPTIVMARNNGEIMGSGRSVEGFNLIEALQELPELFHKFGGHPMACGFTLASPELLEEFKEKLTAIYKKKTKGLTIQKTIDIDCEIDLEDITWELYDLLEKFAPFGQMNPKPKYLSRGVTIMKAEPIGKEGKHLRLQAKHKSNRLRKIVGWNLCNGNETNWCTLLKPGDTVDIVYEISINEWNGNRELQLTITDIKKADTNDANSYANVANHANNSIEIDETHESEGSVIYKDLSYEVNGILFDVHNKLGRNCNEKQICDAIEERLKMKGLLYEREKVLPTSFEGERFGRNRIDFIIENKIIIEIKTKRFVGKEEYRQCTRYLEAFDKKLCILVNFRDKYLNIKRVINPKAKI